MGNMDKQFLILSIALGIFLLTASACAAAADNWPMYHHDVALSGYSTSTAPDTNDTLWILDTGSEIRSSPAIVDGTVYIGALNGKLYAIDFETGIEKWNYTTGGAIYSSPAVASDLIYVLSTDGIFYALNTDGTLEWSRKISSLGNWDWSSPAVNNGNVFIGASNGSMYSLDASTGSINWNTDIGGEPDSPIAVVNGKVYSGTHNFDNSNPTLVALNETTGTIVWEYRYNDSHNNDVGMVNSNGVAVADEDNDGNLELYFGVHNFGSEDNTTIALDEATGNEIWTANIGGDSTSTPAVHDGKVFIGSDDHNVYALDAGTGAKVWSFLTEDEVWASPAIADGKVFFGSLDHIFYAVNEQTGDLIWKYNTSQSRMRGSPGIACGVVITGNENGKVYAFGSPCDATIGDYVWDDLDADGIQDDGEPGIVGVTVNLYDCNDNLIATTITDANGLYEFTVAPGDYHVEFVLPSGFVFSPMDQGMDDTVDSDADTSTGKTMCTTLSSGETDVTWDAGMYQQASMGDFVWNDTDADGIQDNGEVGIEGFTVNLYDCNDILMATTITDSTGFYSFTGLVPGDYYVDFVTPMGYTISPQDQGNDDTMDSDASTSTGQTTCTTLVSGENDLTWDAGMYLTPECGDCEGKVTQLTLRYMGSEAAQVVVTQKKDDAVVFSGTVQPNEEFTFYGELKDDATLGTEITILVDGVKNTRIHTSCSEPIGPGLVSGDFEVVEGYSLNGGLLCPVNEPTEPDCGDCDGKVTQLTLRYMGSEAAQVVVTQKKDDATVFDETVQPGDVFTFYGELKDDATLGTEITILVDGVENTRIHTSCSEPIGPGLVSGDFEVVEGYSLNGGLLCPFNEPPKQECDDSHDHSYSECDDSYDHSDSECDESHDHSDSECDSHDHSDSECDESHDHSDSECDSHDYSDSKYGSYDYSDSKYGSYGYSDSKYDSYGYSDSKYDSYGYSDSKYDSYGYSDSKYDSYGYSDSECDDSHDHSDSECDLHDHS